MNIKEKRIDLFISIYSIFVNLVAPFIMFQIILKLFYSMLKEIEWVNYLTFENDTKINMITMVIFFAIMVPFIMAQKYRYNIFNKAIQKDQEDKARNIFKKWKQLKYLTFIPIVGIWSEIYYFQNKKYIYNFLNSGQDDKLSVVE